MWKGRAILKSLEHRTNTASVTRGYKVESHLDVHFPTTDRQGYKEGPIDFAL